MSFSPELRPDDPLAIHWIRQVCLRLRREVCWLLDGYGTRPGSPAPSPPPDMDSPPHTLDPGYAADSLGLTRHHEEKKRFFRNDPTARYLTALMEADPPPGDTAELSRGSFSWVRHTLSLDDTGCFVLAMALASAFDSAMGTVVSVCLNDASRTRPTLSLAQRLWDRPGEILDLADPLHPLFRYGLVVHTGSPSHHSLHHSHLPAMAHWEGAITVSPVIARHLLFPEAPLPAGLETVVTGEPDDTHGPRDPPRVKVDPVLASRIRSHGGHGLRIVPVIGPRGSGHRETVASLLRFLGRQAVAFQGDPGLMHDPRFRNSLATLCWLRGIDLFMDTDLGGALFTGDPATDRASLPLTSIPVTLFLSIIDRDQLSGIPDHLLLPILHVSCSTYAERIREWQRGLGGRGNHLSSAMAECARRFRYEKETIRRITRGLSSLPGRITPGDLTSACRSEMDLDIGELARRVHPRFGGERLILPERQRRQFEEIATAIASLTTVHYGWGTADAWNESGISVMFSGPPGTGKTMAAEILSARLDLPMYRIDLSQVVNKYIGETEKNLKKLFDTADISDVILFFDEADALFGRRTDVKDSHDRYANLEISYLLERMERFKGVCILATNRKKDLDEAFMRRLRYIVEFPPPGEAERKRIWEQVIPAAVDRSEIDTDFLARQFPLNGGHIRSIVFNACLQSSARSGTAEVIPSATGATHGTLDLPPVLLPPPSPAPLSPLTPDPRPPLSPDLCPPLTPDLRPPLSPDLCPPLSPALPSPSPDDTGNAELPEEVRGFLHMDDIIIAIKREYEKLNRSVSLEHFGRYAHLVRDIEQP